MRAFDAQPLSLNLRADAFRTGHVALSKLALSARGTAGRHRFGLEGSGPGQRLAFDGEGRLRAGPDGARQWVATLGRGHAQGELRFELAPGARIAIGGGNVLLERLRAEIGVGADATRVEILETRFEPGRRLSAEGSLRGLRGALAVRIADLLRARPRPPGPVPASITRLRLDADWKLAGTGLDDLDGRISANVREQRDAAAALDSPAQASSLSLRLTRGRLDGRFAVSLPSLVFLRRYTGDDWVVDGQLALAGTLAGSTSAPLVRGTLEGSQLSLVQRSLGWRFDRGRLRARIDGARLDVDEFVLRSGDGEVRLAGGSRLLETSRRGSAAPTSLPIEGAFSLDADHLQLPFGPGQRLVLSGRTRIEADSGGLRWQGELKADEGVIEVRSGGVPSLPADVVIVPATESAAAEGGDPVPAPDADRAPGVHVSTRVDIDLGRNLRLTGAGVEARLEGRLALRGSLPDAPRMEGVVDVRDGSFVAYGQKLAVTRGAVRFNGPIDNPVLDIVAMRRNQQVEAGVSVTGTVGSPRVRLVSNPEVSDAEKLSWLVLGAPLDRAGGAAQMLALRQAAATLRGDDPSSSAGLADRLGLEYLSVRESSASGQAEVIRDSAPVGGGSQSASATSAQQEVVAIGKRLSSRLLVSYEQGLRGVWNLLRLQYEISERMSLRAQTGTESALDLLFFFRFD
ncbi:MAG: translocation/assembly module TamB domain-containing protein [Burkholderiaceae bacterium]